ncbi:MAG: extracellular solute-binding protein [Alphaproteobacteria bacterium]|nr:extracellular solute-binding protein [Alphaproteobacteria bacterium]
MINTSSVTPPRPALSSRMLLGAAAGAFLLLAGVPRPAAAAEAMLFTWENLAEPVFFEEYKKKYKATPESALFADEDEAFAKMMGGFKPDVMAPCTYEVPRWRDAGLLQPVDPSKISHWKDLPDSLRSLKGMAAEGGKVWFVPQYWGNTSVTIRTDLAPEYAEKNSWDILWDPKYKGRIAALEGVDDTFAITALHLGIDPYEPLSAENEKKVRAHMTELAQNLRLVTSDSTTLVQAVASGEVVAAITWNDHYTEMKAESLPVKFMRPKGIITFVCGFVMHKETKSVEKAQALIDSNISEASSHFLVSEMGYGPSNTKSLKTIDAAVLEKAELPADVDAFLASGTFQRTLPNKDMLVQMWQEIRAMSGR